MAAHRYWRLVCLQTANNNSGNVSLGEIQLLDGGGTNRVGTGTASASSVYPGFPAANAIDGNAGTEWYNNGSEANAGWWQYDFGAGNAWDIQSVIITSTTVSSDWVVTPYQFILLYSDDGTTWSSTVAVQAGSAITGGGQSRTVPTPGTLAPVGAWDPFDHTAVSYSGNNLVATGWSINAGARSTYRNTGKYYFEGTYTIASANSTGIGFANSSAAVNSFGGSAVNAFMTYHGFTPYFNGSSGVMSSFNPVPQGTTVCFALDLTNALLWVKQGAAGQWNGSGTANPATGVGGFDFSVIGHSVAPAVSGATSGDAIALNVGGSAFVGTVPTAYSAWNGAAQSGAATQARVMVMA